MSEQTAVKNSVCWYCLNHFTLLLNQQRQQTPICNSLKNVQWPLTCPHNFISHNKTAQRLFSPPPFSCSQQQRLWFDCLFPVTDGNDRAEQNPFCKIQEKFEYHENCFNMQNYFSHWNGLIWDKLYLEFLVRKRGTMTSGSSGVVSMMTWPSGKNRRYLW